ncbi:MAG: hypothetical protein WAN06_03705 [Candidatus Sulfotelmatobacter sp.]
MYCPRESLVDQYGWQDKTILSPDAPAVEKDKVIELVVLAVCFATPRPLISIGFEHAQPFGAGGYREPIVPVDAAGVVPSVISIALVLLALVGVVPKPVPDRLGHVVVLHTTGAENLTTSFACDDPAHGVVTLLS